MARSATLTVMIKAVEKAARSLKRDFGEVENLQVSRKGPGDFVSTADRNAEDTLRQELSKARPDFAFLMEESGAVGASDAPDRWIIDPLDGTTNFLHGVPHWCISLAWEHKGSMQAGVVYDPIKDELFFAEKGAGAFLNSRRLRVSARTELDTVLMVVGMGPVDAAGRQEWARHLSHIGRQVSAIRHSGSSALDLAYVAAGRFDAFWQPVLDSWDFAAGSLILREAGGQVTRVDGSPLASGRGSILATNGALHKWALGELVVAGGKSAPSAKKVG